MACAFSSVPPASRYAVIPVARNVWQPIRTRVPRSAARRWTMRQASTRPAFGQHAGAADGGAEQGSLAGVSDFRGVDIGVEIGFEVVMRRHLVALAAFLMQPHPPALAVGVIVLDAHGDDRADAREGEGHHRDQRAVAEAHESRDIDAVDQLARLFAGRAQPSYRS